jgi:hypothetical protein
MIGLMLRRLAGEKYAAPFRYLRPEHKGRCLRSMEQTVSDMYPQLPPTSRG